MIQSRLSKQAGCQETSKTNVHGAASLAIALPTINVRRKVKPATNAEAETILAAVVELRNVRVTRTNRPTLTHKVIPKKMKVVRTIVKRQTRNQRLRTEKPSNWLIRLIQILRMNTFSVLEKTKIFFLETKQEMKCR